MERPPCPQRQLHDSLLASAADPALAHKPAVIVEGMPYTYAQLLDASQRLAAGLLARGVTRGDRVAIYMDNSWPCVVSIFAVLLAGGVFLLINPQTKSEKLGFILDDSGARLLLTDGHLAQEFVPLFGHGLSPAQMVSSGKLPESDTANRYSPRTSSIRFCMFVAMPRPTGISSTSLLFPPDASE